MGGNARGITIGPEAGWMLMLSYWQVILPFSLICQADGFMRVQGLGSEESSRPGQRTFLSSREPPECQGAILDHFSESQRLIQL